MTNKISLDTPSTLIGDSHDVTAYRGYCNFCERVNARPIPWKVFYTNRLAELKADRCKGGQRGSEK